MFVQYSHEHNGKRRVHRPAVETADEGSEPVTKRLVARAASVSCRTVDNWIRDKRIPVIRLSPRCVRFHLPRVLAALGRFEIREVTTARNRLPKAKRKTQNQEVS